MQRVNNSTATPGGFSSTGDTTVSSAVITNVPDTTGLYVGDYISFDAGFDEALGSRLRVVSLTLTTITVDRVANASEVGIAIASLSKMYTDGVVDTVARTILNSKYMNLLQEEIASAIEDDGGTLDEADIRQLSKVLQSKLALAGGTMTGNIVQGNTSLVKTELNISDWSDLTYLSADANVKYYKITINAAAYNTVRFSFTTDDPGHADGLPWVIKLNLNGGAVGQDFTIINNCGPYPWDELATSHSLVWSKTIQIQSRWFNDPNKKAIFLQVHPQSSLVLRRLLASPLAYTHADRLGWFPGEGTSGHCWKVMAGAWEIKFKDGYYVTEA